MRIRRWSVLVLGLSIACGITFVAASISSGGSDLRPAGGDINTVLTVRSHNVETLQNRLTKMQDEVDDLTAVASKRGENPSLERARKQVNKLEPRVALQEVKGSGIRVTLTDAPRNVEAPDGEAGLLVVHQQDIQAFVNAMWSGGAKAVTLQGQRLTALTGIKCVGNTVVLDGVPYSPPYVIEAIGEPWRLGEALESSAAVRMYGEHAERYGLGLRQEYVEDLVAPAAGLPNVEHAAIVRR